MAEPSLAELQAAVHEWISQWEEGYFHPLSNLARLTEEVGELFKAIRKWERFYDQAGADQASEQPRESERAHVGEEIVDVLNYLLAIARAFAAQGWKWGGHWTSSKDYQHFSASGR